MSEKKVIAVVGTIQQFKAFPKVLPEKVEYVHVYHEKVLNGREFDTHVCLSDNPYLLRVAAMCEIRTRKKPHHS